MRHGLIVGLLALLPAGSPARSAVLTDDFESGAIGSARWKTSVGAGGSFVGPEGRNGGHCVHLFGDHSTSELVTATPVADDAYTLTFDFLQPAGEAWGYQAVIQHPRPEGHAYWWFEFGADRFFLYTFGAGVWHNRWAAWGLTTDTWYRIRIRNTPTTVQITVYDLNGKPLCESPIVIHDEGGAAPIRFAAVGDAKGSRGMKVDNVAIAVTPIVERPDFLQREASIDAASKALVASQARNLWPEGQAQLATIANAIGALRGMSADDWAAYQGAVASLDRSLTELARTYHDRVIARIPPAVNGWTLVDLWPYANDDAEKRGLHLEGSDPVTTYGGIPFLTMPFGRNALLQDLPHVGDTTVPLKCKADRIGLLMGALYERELYDHDDSLIDVLQVGLCYADGVEERLFPLRASDGRPIMPYGQVAAFTVAPGHAAEIRELVLHDQSSATGWGLLGLSYRPGTPAELPPIVAPRRTTPRISPKVVSFRDTANSLAIDNGLFRLAISKRPCLLTSLASPYLGKEALASPSPLFALQLGKSVLFSDRFAVTTVNPSATSDGGRQASLSLSSLDGQPPLRVQVSLAANQSPRLRCRITLRNEGKEPLSPRLVFPLLDGLDLGPSPGWYFPQRGGAVSHRALEGLSSYGGMAWLQVADVFGPLGGVYVRSDDTSGAYKVIGLRSIVRGEQARRIADIPLPAHACDPWRATRGAHLSIQYLPPTLKPGETWSPSSATLAVHDGDYRVALRDYHQWLHTWWRNRPCPAAYRYGFYALVGGAPNDSQRHEECGSYDWWHLSPLWSIDYLDELKREVGELQTQANRAKAWGQGVGVYIEGMVMEKSRRIARERGSDWAMKDDEGNYYTYYSSPANPTWSMCPAVKEWQQWDSSAYAEIARRVPLVAMYVDSTGSRWAEVCYNAAHNHSTPGIWPRGCGELFEALRKAVVKVSPTTAIHSEEPGCDYMALHEDGSWSHSLWTALSGDAEYNPAGLNYFRFVLPEFKMYEIPSYRHALWRCKLAFFNGEGLWTNQPDAARQALFIKWMPTLREHADTFTGTDVEGEMPIVSPPLYANRFSSGAKTIYTLYNSGTHTCRAVVDVNWPKGGHCIDLLELREVPATVKGAQASLALTLHPHEVLCLMVAPSALKASAGPNILWLNVAGTRPGEQIVATPINAEGVRGKPVIVPAPKGAEPAKISAQGWSGKVLVRVATEHDTRDEVVVELVK